MNTHASDDINKSEQGTDLYKNEPGTDLNEQGTDLYKNEVPKDIDKNDEGREEAINQLEPYAHNESTLVKLLDDYKLRVVFPNQGCISTSC